MNLILLGLGAALVVVLPTRSLAQGTGKPAVERPPVLKRGNPTAAPKASPSLTSNPCPTPEGQLSPSAPATSQTEVAEEDEEPVQARAAAPGSVTEPTAAPATVTCPSTSKKGQTEPAAAVVRETEPPEDETGGAQP
jgi:hypothetical protein